MTKQELIETINQINDNDIEQIMGIVSKYVEPKEPKKIISPIVFEGNCGGSGDSVGIVNNKGQVLWSGEGMYGVNWRHKETDKIQCELIQVDVKDLKVDYTYFGSHFLLEDSCLGQLLYYLKYLGGGKFACSTGNGHEATSIKYKYWYQCVPIKGDN
jgi:hypothetical protein